jgi:hypothetical protein
MITFIFIAVCFLISFILSYVNRNTPENKRLGEEKVSKALNYMMLFILVGVILINAGVFDKKVKIDESEITSIEEIVVDEEPIVLTDQQKYLSSLGFKTDAEFSDVQFKEFKTLMDSEIFKDKDFCSVFHKTMKLSGKELKNYIKSISKQPYFEDMVIMYGMKVCEPYSKEDMDSRRKPSYQSSDIVCEMSKNFIKQDLNYPKSADFSMFDCSVENNSDGSYTILRKVGAKNAFGVESEFIYKVRLGYTGGIDVDIENWKLISILSEEVR